MSKHLRHQPGFYATLFNDVCDPACNSKYRPIVVAVYEVERIVTKRVKGGREKYLIQWQNYSSNENTSGNHPKICRKISLPPSRTGLSIRFVPMNAFF